MNWESAVQKHWVFLGEHQESTDLTIRKIENHIGPKDRGRTVHPPFKVKEVIR
jgi:hypothetical protein